MDGKAITADGPTPDESRRMVALDFAIRFVEQWGAVDDRLAEVLKVSAAFDKFLAVGG